MALDLTWFDVDGDIETFYTYCLHHMEGCDEPEWTMYNRITAVIEDTIAEMPNALKMLEDS